MAHIKSLRRALVSMAIVLSPPTAAAVQQGSDTLQSRKLDLEVKKLELEVAKLKAQEFPGWLIGVAGLLLGVAGTASSLWAARRSRFGALDQSVHDKRLESYPRLVKTSAPLAVYFPNRNLSTESIEPKECGAMGKAMSKWYFEGGGLLMSEESRDSYFKLVRALTLASLAKDLRAPRFPMDAEKISIEKLKQYRAKLSSQANLCQVENWNFGGAASEKEPAEVRFKDYVFLQQLSSTLRTALAKDLRSRRRPSK